MWFFFGLTTNKTGGVNDFLTDVLSLESYFSFGTPGESYKTISNMSNLNHFVTFFILFHNSNLAFKTDYNARLYVKTMNTPDTIV